MFLYVVHIHIDHYQLHTVHECAQLISNLKLALLLPLTINTCLHAWCPYVCTEDFLCWSLHETSDYVYYTIQLKLTGNFRRCVQAIPLLPTILLLREVELASGGYHDNSSNLHTALENPFT